MKYRIELSNEPNGSGWYVATVYADDAYAWTALDADRNAAKAAALTWIAADRDHRAAGTETIEL